MEGFTNAIVQRTLSQKELHKITCHFQTNGKQYAYINPIVYLALRHEKKLLNNIDYFFVDGILLVWLLRLARVRTKRMSPDMVGFFGKLFHYASEKELNIYFVGSEQKIIESTISVLKEGFPKLKISGFRNGFFNSKEEKLKTMQEVVRTDTDILIIGMGTPHQEQFLENVKESRFIGQTFTCGGFIHQTARGLVYYSKWINLLNLRWAYRIYDEPKLFQRYLFKYPKFIFVFLLDLTRHMVYSHIKR